jgi:hypothetical protein
MKHFKRLCKDAQQIVNELRDLVTWKNFIVTIPAIMLFAPIMLFWLLFEDYEENDKWEREITEYLKQQEQ